MYGDKSEGWIAGWAARLVAKLAAGWVAGWVDRVGRQGGSLATHPGTRKHASKTEARCRHGPRADPPFPKYPRI